MQLGDKEYTPTRYGLKKWLELDDIKAKILDAAENRDAFANGIIDYLSAALCIPTSELEEFSWYEVIVAYAEINNANKLNYQFPLFKEPPNKDKAPWEYDGRLWYKWAYALSKEFGWSLEYVAELDPDDGIALLQEILVNDQLEKEWQWGMSEIAYQYNETTKKSEFKEYPRPIWMQKEVRKPPTKAKIPASMLPVGIVRHFKMDGSSETT